MAGIDVISSLALFVFVFQVVETAYIDRNSVVCSTLDISQRLNICFVIFTLLVSTHFETLKKYEKKQNSQPQQLFYSVQLSSLTVSVFQNIPTTLIITTFQDLHPSLRKSINSFQINFSFLTSLILSTKKLNAGICYLTKILKPV